jgi:nuclear transport factor 2 (NTF2) superfamily protein
MDALEDDRLALAVAQDKTWRSTMELLLNYRAAVKERLKQKGTP